MGRSGGIEIIWMFLGMGGFIEGVVGARSGGEAPKDNGIAKRCWSAEWRRSSEG